jgi:hypothetical protein
VATQVAIVRALIGPFTGPISIREHFGDPQLTRVIGLREERPALRAFLVSGRTKARAHAGERFWYEQHTNE